MDVRWPWRFPPPHIYHMPPYCFGDLKKHEHLCLFNNECSILS
ncbi:hypothetical protein B4113_1152 [Geobacillus sp. B4113_201601]|nr:hypothetical protein B4113_1152 [Geobacillus sp. B4113_201601]